jgi:hypothetical protein
MAKKSKKPQKRAKPRARLDLSLKDIHVYLILLVVGVVARLPILKAFDLVTFDGTSYINQARFLLRGAVGGGAFPLGYPGFIAVFTPIIGDDVRAAQVVSFFASLGTTFVLYLLARQFIEKKKAFFCALVLAVHPLFLRLSLTTFSESLYIFWVCLGLLFYARNKDLYFGIAIGLASITRPEAMAIFGILALLRLKQPKRWLPIGLSFAVLFMLNAAYLSKATGRVVLLPKTGFLGTSAQKWQLRETSVEFEGKEETFKELEEESQGSRVVDYFRRMPGELRELHRYILPVLLVLALFGMIKRPTFVLAALVPFLFYPAFTVRSEPRYLLPYVPIFILYAFIGLDRIHHKTGQVVARVLILISTLGNPLINREQLTKKINPQYIGSKVAGLLFRDRVVPTDKIADRKPFFAFYAGGEYVEIPLAPYDDVMDFLMEQNIKLLSLHRLTTRLYRPALRPLVHDRPAILGELRFEQVYWGPNGELIYERALDADPLTWTKLTDFKGTSQAPVWSPDGQLIAFRGVTDDGRQGIFATKADGSESLRLVEVSGTDDPLTWSPDGTRLAFSGPTGDNLDIYTFDLGSGRVAQITSDPGNDISPTWSKSGAEIAFCSDRTGSDEIWVKNLGTGETTQLTTTGNNRYPLFSNAGTGLAWVENTNVVIHDSTTRRRTIVRGTIAYRPTWSPDDRFIAMESDAWGTVGIYIVASDANEALLLTKKSRPTGMPAWSPSGDQMAVMSTAEDEASVWLLSGLDSYMARLTEPIDIHTFEAEDKK